MKEDEFQYAGFNSRHDLGVIVSGSIQKPLAPTMNEITQDIPGKYGNLYSGTNFGSISFDIPITIPAENSEEYNYKMQNLRNALIDARGEEHLEYPLSFWDEPNIVYYGHWTSLPTPTFLPNSWYSQTTLTFTCSEPYSYGPQKEIQVSNPAQKLNVQGNAPTPPVITYNLKKDVFNLGYLDSDSGEYVATGYSVDVDNTDDQKNKIQDKEPLSVDASSETLADWNTDVRVTGSIPLDNGEIDGEMDEFTNWGIAPGSTTRTDKNRKTSQEVNAVNFGETKKHKGWYGPLAVRQSVPNPSNDWRICVNIRHIKRYSRGMGKVEIYLLDENGNRCGKLWLKDQEQGKVPKVGMQLGTKKRNTDMITYGGQAGYGGPTYVPGTDKKLIKNGENRTVTFQVLRNYKVAVVNKSYTDKQQVTYVNKKAPVSEKKQKQGQTTTTRRVKQVGKPGSYYQNNKPKGEGTEVGQDSTKKAPSNTHWENKSNYDTKTAADYNNRNVFSNFNGDFFLEKIGTRFRCWIQVQDSDEGPIGTPIAQREFIDETGEYDFALNSIAAYTAKHDISEDRTENSLIYDDVLLGVGGFKHWNIIEGGNQSLEQPQIIAHSGEQVIVDSEQMKVFKTDGIDLTKFTSFASSFPMIKGGEVNNFVFTPLPGNDTDLTINYRPRYK